MKHVILLGLLTVAWLAEPHSCTNTTSTAFAGDSRSGSGDRPASVATPDLRTYPPRDTYERQLQDYQRHGYDSGRNGSLSQESNIQREDRERASGYGYEQPRQDYRQHNTWGNSRSYGDASGDNTGGYNGGQCLYGC